nr:hydroxyisourate hydrolase [Oceanococcus sp. HetDA_MAG_MS8]
MPEQADAAVGGISIHCVDIARGIPAEGLQIRLWRVAETRELIASGSCSASGVLPHSDQDGQGIIAGLYEVEFDVAKYYRAASVAVPNPAFMETAIYRFGIEHLAEHFHLPFKFTPWGFSLFRGGACPPCF